MNPQIFEAFGKPERLEMVELLRKNPRSVNELASLLNLRQPQTSKQLKILADAGVVEVKKEKQTHIYYLSPSRFEEMDMWIQEFRKLWDVRFERLDKVFKSQLDS